MLPPVRAACARSPVLALLLTLALLALLLRGASWWPFAATAAPPAARSAAADAAPPIISEAQLLRLASPEPLLDGGIGGDGKSASSSFACATCPSAALDAELESAADGTAVIVEPRPSAALTFALRHMAATLPRSWLLVLITRAAARPSIFAEFGALIAAGRLRVWELAADTHALTRVCGDGGSCAAARVLPAVLRSGAGVSAHAATGGWAAGWALANEAQVRPELFATLPTESYLVFQTDGLLCAPVNASTLRAFAGYAFVGAPWPFGWTAHPWHASGSPTAVGGNGGFSLRAKSAMLRVVRSVHWDGENEDIWLTRHAHATGGVLPPVDVAGAFALEGLFTRASAGALGFHKPWSAISPALTAEQYAVFARACPVAERVRSAAEAASVLPKVAVAVGLAIAALIIARLAIGAARAHRRRAAANG